MECRPEWIRKQAEGDAGSPTATLMWPSHPHVGECLLNNALGMEVRLSCWRLVCCGEHGHLQEQRPWGSGGAGYLDVLRCPFPVLQDQASGVPLKTCLRGRRRHHRSSSLLTMTSWTRSSLGTECTSQVRGSTVRPLTWLGADDLGLLFQCQPLTSNVVPSQTAGCLVVRNN